MNDYYNENKESPIGLLSLFFVSILECSINNDYNYITNAETAFNSYVDLLFVDNIIKIKFKNEFLLIKNGSFIHINALKNILMNYNDEIKNDTRNNHFEILINGLNGLVNSSIYVHQTLIDRLNVVNIKREKESTKRYVRRSISLEYDDQIRKCIILIHRTGNINIIQLSKLLRIHVKDIEDIIKVLKDIFLIDKNENNIHITNIGQYYCSLYLGLRIDNLIDWNFEKENYYLNKSELETYMNDFFKMLDSPNPYYYQWYFDIDSIIKIIEVLDKNMDLQGRSIICMMCPTVAVGISKTNLAREVYTMDCDGKLLKLISNYTQNKVKTIEYNIEKPIPIELKNKFDSFIIDPPYDEGYYMLGLSRCVDLLGNIGKEYNNKSKSGYIVIPPHEISYLKRLGKPPLIINLLSKLEFMGFFVENMWIGDITYQTPPFEKYILRKRLNIYTDENWRTSDLIKLRLFRDSASVYPSEYSLPNIFPIYERYKSRFIKKCMEITDDLTYITPEVQIYEAKEWDEFLIPLSIPDFLCFHDIGKPGEDSNKLIKCIGPISKYLWDHVDNNVQKSIKTNIKDIMPQINSLFKNVPELSVLEKEIKSFIFDLISCGLLSKTDFINL